MRTASRYAASLAVMIQAASTFAAQGEPAAPCEATPLPGLHLATSARRLPPTVLLRSRSPFGLELIDIHTNSVLWSAGPDAAAMQRFEQMSATFGSSLTAVDVNSDLTHDRVYAGDAAGRLWRFDIHWNAAVTELFTGGVLADLSTDTAFRPIVAAPDVALIAPRRLAPWLNISVGTAWLPGSAVKAHLFVVRDRHVFTPLPQSHYLSAAPMRPSDLLTVGANRAAPTAVHATSGFALDLGTLAMDAQTITIDERIIGVARDRSRVNANCERPTYIVSIHARTGEAAIDANADGTINESDRQLRVEATRNGTAPNLVRAPLAAQPARYICMLAGRSIPGCSTELRAVRSYWTRQDAD